MSATISPAEEHPASYAEFHALVAQQFDADEAALIDRALTLVDRLLAGRTRFDGKPLAEHSVHTAAIVIEQIGLERHSVVATLLHDAMRLGLCSAEEISKRFGTECIPLLEGLCNISDIPTKVAPGQADDFRDLIVSYSTDPRVILIKLADRLEVMRSLTMFPEAKRLKKSWESLYLYAQIAHKLGLYPIKSELEDLSLRWLEPADYAHIVRKLEETAAERNQFIARFLIPIEERLTRGTIRYHIKSRTKSIYSIWLKMKRAQIPFEEVFDLFALRIIIDCPAEEEKALCWYVYSVVTDCYTPNPDRLRDWISIPKSNGYESLHTTVVTPDGHWVEIQIRTERMDEVAERGIAAHWRYKGVAQGGSEEWLARLRELIEGTDVRELAGRFDARPASGEIFVFTPRGDIRKLPEGATLLDFAYDIHTAVGATCTGGRINRHNVQLREVLHNGDIVEVLTSKNQHPKADWLSFVRTPRAKSKIRAWLREEQARTSGLAREELERKLRNWKLSIPIDDAVTVLCKYYKCRTGTDLYGRIAEGKIEIGDTKELFIKHLSGTLFEPKARAAASPKSPAEDEDNGDALVIDDSIRGIDYKLARCCNPIFGDEIFGFTTVSAGITIHRADCPNARRLKELYPYRIQPARWRHTTAAGAFRATLRIAADDRVGMTGLIADRLTELKINIRSMNLASVEGTLRGTIVIEVTGSALADRVIHELSRIAGMQRVYRIAN